MFCVLFLDFGVLCVVCISLLLSLFGAGMVNYMAFEFFDDGRADEKVDVYLFVMIFCEMFSGK